MDLKKRNLKLLWIGRVNDKAASILIDDNKNHYLSYDAGDHFTFDWQSGNDNYVSLERDIYKAAFKEGI